MPHNPDSLRESFEIRDVSFDVYCEFLLGKVGETMGSIGECYEMR